MLKECRSVARNTREVLDAAQTIECRRDRTALMNGTDVENVEYPP